MCSSFCDVCKSDHYVVHKLIHCLCQLYHNKTGKNKVKKYNGAKPQFEEITSEYFPAQ